MTFLGTDIDHDGGKIIIVAGAPSTSGEDEQRMLVALREVMDQDRHPPLRGSESTVARSSPGTSGPPTAAPSPSWATPSTWRPG